MAVSAVMNFESCPVISSIDRKRVWISCPEAEAPAIFQRTMKKQQGRSLELDRCLDKSCVVEEHKKYILK